MKYTGAPGPAGASGSKGEQGENGLQVSFQITYQLICKRIFIFNN